MLQYPRDFPLAEQAILDQTPPVVGIEDSEGIRRRAYVKTPAWSCLP